MRTGADNMAIFAGKLAEAAMLATERGDKVNAAFFAIKAAETLSLAKALGFDAAKAAEDAMHLPAAPEGK